MIFINYMKYINYARLVPIVKVSFIKCNKLIQFVLKFCLVSVQWTFRLTMNFIYIVSFYKIIIGHYLFLLKDI